MYPNKPDGRTKSLLIEKLYKSGWCLSSHFYERCKGSFAQWQKGSRMAKFAESDYKDGHVPLLK